MEHEVKVQRREATLVLAKRTPVRLSEIGQVLGMAFGEVYAGVQAHGGDADGPPFVIYHEVPAGDNPFEIEICAPVRRAIEAPAGWSLTELPAGVFASMLHVGPYDTVATAYGAIVEWIGSHGYAVAGPPREVYFSEPETPPEQVRTIIEFPVAQVMAPAGVR
jgi:effector-binding domain-containing protein